MGADGYGTYALSENIENGVARAFSVTVIGNALPNILTAAAGAQATTLVGGDGDDVLIDLGGRATLRGGAGADTYRVWSIMSTPTVISDAESGTYDGASQDVLEFAQDLNPSDVTFSRADNPYDLLISQSNGGRIAIVNFFANDLLRDQVEIFRFSDGLELTANTVAGGLVIQGTSGADTLVSLAQGSDLLGLAGDDILIGGSGNDFLDGGLGSDHYGRWRFVAAVRTRCSTS